MQGCNLCGGTWWETLEAVGDTRVVRCACGLVFVTPQPPRSSLEQAYDEAYYRPWGGQAQRRERLWQRRMKRLETFAKPPGRLLDVGCATGTFLRLARSHGWETAGTELSPYGAKAAQEDGLAVIAGEVWEAGFPQGTFDVITCWHVIEHVSDPRRVMDEFVRILRPGGWLVLATPNQEDHFFRAAYALSRWRRPHLYEPNEREVHLYFFSARTLWQLATSIGLDVLEIGFDRGAAAVWGKQFVDAVAYKWFRLTGQHLGMGLELVARKPVAGCTHG